jgi:hypothetical protein
MLHPNDQIRIRNQRQIAQCFTQVARTDLAGSTGPVNCFSEANSFFFHGRASYSNWLNTSMVCVITGNKRLKISENPDLIAMSDYDIEQP